MSSTLAAHLTAAAIEAVVAQCSAGYSVNPTTMRAVVQHESGGHPWAVGNNTNGQRFFARTKEEAVSYVRQAIARGHSVDTGLAQFNTHNMRLPSFRGMSVEQLFDPCTSVKIGAHILDDCWRIAQREFGSSMGGQKALQHALSCYNRGPSGLRRGRDYVSKVLAAAAHPRPFKGAAPPASTATPGQLASSHVVVNQVSAPISKVARTTSAPSTPRGYAPPAASLIRSSSELVSLN